jgi:hypothetical protein|tara:strand:- start:2733 stop:4268 length:1536 start_codon:yes stop_codon:yes gene_type:complete
MSDIKEQIQFSNTMGLDKRNPALAYLRKNAFRAGTPGLYPARDFYQERPDTLTASQDIVDILGNEELTFDIKVIVNDGADVRFYNLGSNTESNTAEAGVDYECGTDGNDGVYACFDNDTVKRVNYQNSNISAIGTFSGGRPSVGGFDGLFYWWFSQDEIYKQLPNAAPTVAFNDLGISPDFVSFHNDEAVIFAQDGNDIVILFWDKSDLDLFEKRILIKNARLIAGGVINGRLTLVRGVGNSSNPKEQNGELVVSHYNGENFEKVNSIKAGDDEIDFYAQTGVGIGSEVMLFSVNRNVDSHNTDLYQNYIYKIYEDGSIEVQCQPDETTFNDTHVVRVFYNFICYAQRGSGAQPSVIFINEDTNDSYGDFENYTTTEYITEFKGSPRNDHKLDGFMVAFEKLFEQTDTASDPVTGEELDVYYRLSEREDFTLLMNVTALKVRDDVNPKRDESVEYASDTQGMHEQRYMIESIEGQPLPEFNEIQYKFVLKRGFTIIDAWHRYSYTSRNPFQ